jgi:hypothetical protein
VYGVSQPETTATNKPAITSRQTPRVTDSQVALLLILQEKDVSNMVSGLRLNCDYAARGPHIAPEMCLTIHW